MNGQQGHLTIEQVEHLLSVEFDLSGKQIAPDSLADACRHLADCETCKDLFTVMKEGDLVLHGLKRDTASAPAENCPSAVQLYQLVAGLLKDEESAELIEHASECDHCGPTLRQVTEQLDNAQTDGEVAGVSVLKTSKPTWQAEFGRRLALTVSSENKERAGAAPPSKILRPWAWHRQKLTWALTGVAAILVLVFLVGVVRRPRSSDTDTPGHAEALLAAAYAKRRTLEPRIPGAQQSVLQVDRSDHQLESEVDKPESLRKAEDLIAKHRNSDSVGWLEARTRMELLDGHYNLAIQTGKEAVDKGAQSPSLLNDLGVAYFERGKQAGKAPDGVAQGALDYGQAYNYLSQALAQDSKYVVALFNRALVAERSELYTQAEDDWSNYLEIETDPNWKSEALTNLERVQKKRSEQKHRTQIQLDRPTQLVDALSSGERERIENIDRFADEYLIIAVEQWIPEFLSDRPTNRRHVLAKALRLLGDDLRVRHGDSWLSDFVSEPSFPRLSRPIESLVRAMHANIEGDHQSAIRFSNDAERQFQNLGDVSGRLFAAFETVYSNRLAAHGRPCHERAKAVIAEAHERGYVWVEVQSRLEAASCAVEVSRIDESVAGSQKALELARLSKYKNLQLRALMFAADLLGDISKRLDLVDDGLHTFWEGQYDPMRGYSFYALMDTSADELHLWFWDIAAIQEGLQLIEADPQLATLCGMERYRLARAQLAIGDFDAARRASIEARSFLNRGSSKTLVAGASIDLAEALVMKGNYRSALDLLDSAAPDFSSFTQDVVAAKYYSTRAAALLGNGQRIEAQPVLNTALRLAQKGFASISAERDRLSWSQSFEPAYRALASMHLKDDAESSLWWWESFKGASINGKSAEYFEVRMQKLPRFDSWLNDGTVLLSYASFSDGIVVWTYDGQRVQSRMIPNSETNVESLVHLFHDACADRNSDSSRLALEGKQLYELLISPVEASLQGKSRLIIEADHSLEGLPFEALVDRRDYYLGDSYEIEYSPGIFYLAQNTRQEQVGNQDPALVVGNSLADPTLGLPPLPGALEEAQEVAAQFDHHKLLIDDDTEREQIPRELPRADVFHFAGHAIGNQQISALVLAPSDVKDASRLLDASSFNFAVLRRARLVVLSGCSTANGIGIGFNDRDSLARNALAAGVSTVVASRWLADSVATREWMKVFYQEVLSGRRMSASAKEARVNLKKNEQWRHPFFWSVFSVFV